MKNLFKISVISSLLIITSLLICSCGGGAEQFVQGQGQIDITATDSVSNARLALVSIEVRESAGGAVKNTFTTDSNGYYKFLGTVGTDYYFTFSKSGYATSIQYVKTPQLTATGTLDVPLVPALTTLTITTTSPLPTGTVGTAYNLTMAASSGSAPYTWTTAAGSPLPAGLTLSTAGVITGTPTITGTVSASINVTDAAAVTATKTFSITINAAGSSLSITTATLASATYGTVYSQPLVATGGTTPYTWALASGTLPAGLTLSATGVTGTPTAPAIPNAATSNFTIRVTDAALASATMPLATTASLSASASSGRTTYDANCAGCHRLGIYDVNGGSPNLGGLGTATLTTALNARFAGGASHNGRTLSAALITDMLNFLNLY